MGGAGTDGQFSSHSLFAGQVIQALRQCYVDYPLSALILIKNDLLIVATAWRGTGDNIGDLHNFVPSNNTALHRPIDVALLRVLLLDPSTEQQ